MAEAKEADILDRVAASGCVPFSYDSENQQFNLGIQSFRLTPDVFSRMFTAFPDAEPVPTSSLYDHALVRKIADDTYSLPRLLQAYEEQEVANELAEDTITVMQKTLSTLVPHDTFDRKYFDCWLRPQQAFEARVLGSAALHPMAEGQIGEKGWPFGIYEYGTNNADLTEWEITLYAGLGHVAHVADKMD